MRYRSIQAGQKLVINVLAYENTNACMHSIRDCIKNSQIEISLFSEWSFSLSLSESIIAAKISRIRPVVAWLRRPIRFIQKCLQKIMIRPQRLILQTYLRAYRFILLPILRFVWLCDTLLLSENLLRESTSILVQNPPSVPALLILQPLAKLFGCKLIVDWHNVGTTILKYESFKNDRLYKSLEKYLLRKPGNIFTSICTMKNFDVVLFVHFCFEIFFGKGDINIVVSARMQEFLTKLYSLSIFDRLRYAIYVACSSDLHTDSVSQVPAAGSIVGNFIIFRDLPLKTMKHLNKSSFSISKHEELVQKYWDILSKSIRESFILIMSCSWSCDDDLEFFYAMLEIIFRKSNHEESDPSANIHFIVTGTGPSHHRFLQKLRNSRITELEAIQEESNSPSEDSSSCTVHYRSQALTSIYFHSYDGYLEALSRSHIGISLHRSSSMLDLPMKVVEYSSCGVPSIALDYPGMEEGMQYLNEEDNQRYKIGWTSHTPQEMAGQIQQCAASHASKYDVFYSDIAENVRRMHVTPSNSWEEKWDALIAPILDLV